LRSIALNQSFFEKKIFQKNKKEYILYVVETQVSLAIHVAEYRFVSTLNQGCFLKDAVN